MDFLKLAQNRYTTKKYDSTKKVSTEDVKALKEILRLSASSINSQPWKFIHVESTALKAELAKASFFNEPKVLDSSELFVFCAIDDVQAFEKEIETRLPEGAQNYYKKFIQILPEHEIKAWFRSQVYLALGSFLSACALMEIDSTPMEGIDTQKYDELLKLKGYKSLFGVCVGYRDVEDTNQPHLTPKKRKDLDEVVQTF